MRKDSGMVKIQKYQKGICVMLYVLLVGFGIFANIEYGFSLYKTVSYAALSAGCLIIAHIDHREHRIPNRILLILLLVRMLLLFAEIIGRSLNDSEGWSFGIFFRSCTGLTFGLVIMLFVYIISRHAIGMGDVKLSAVIGFFMETSGWYTALLIGSIAAAGFSVVQLIRKKMKLKDEIPLGPFFAFGVVAAVIIGA